MNKQNIIFVVVLCIALVSTTVAVMLYIQGNQTNQPPAPVTDTNSSVDKDGKLIPSPYERKQVKNTIVKNSGEIQKCYNSFIKENPKVSDGKIKLDWMIAEDGDVSRVTVVSSQLKSPTFKTCLMEKIEDWSFPPPPNKGNVYVAHEFRFSKDPPKRPGEDSMPKLIPTSQVPTK